MGIVERKQKVYYKKTKKGNILKVSTFLVCLYLKYFYVHIIISSMIIFKFLKAYANYDNCFFQNVREHYLSNDISCGLSICKFCEENDSLTQVKKSESTKVKKPHHILIDTNVALHQVSSFDL